MKGLILLISLLLTVGGVFPQSPDFYERVLSHLDCRNCYFITINVRSSEFTGTVVIENDALLDYFESTQKISKDEYKTMMLEVLRKKKEVLIEEARPDPDGFFLVGKNLGKRQFRIVEPSQSFEVVSTRGCPEMLRYYFSPSPEETSEEANIECKRFIMKNQKDLFLRPRFNFAEQNNVIAQLFKLEIPIYMDDISGSPKIGFHTVK